MKIDDFMSLDPELRRYASMPEMDPLTEEDALQEAQVAGVRFDALTRVVGIIFERRQALQLREANTGVLIAHGVWELSWSGSKRDEGLSAWPIDSSVPRTTGRLFRRCRRDRCQ